MYLFRRSPAESLIIMACSLRSTRLQGRAKKREDGGRGRGRGGGEERRGKRKWISPEGWGGIRKGGEREERRRRNGEAEGRELIWRGRESTVWACKMAYGGLSI